MDAADPTSPRPDEEGAFATEDDNNPADADSNLTSNLDDLSPENGEDGVAGEAALGEEGSLGGGGGGGEEGGDLSARAAQGDEWGGGDLAQGSGEGSRPVSGESGRSGRSGRSGGSGTVEQLGSHVPAAGLGAMSGGQDAEGNNLPRGGGEEGGARNYAPQSSDRLRQQANAVKVHTHTHTHNTNTCVTCLSLRYYAYAHTRTPVHQHTRNRQGVQSPCVYRVK